jgi:hypothetical protein
MATRGALGPKKVEENSIPNGKVGDAKKPVETKPPAAAKRTAGKKEPPKPAEPEKKSEPPEIVGKLVDVTVNQGQKIEYVLKVNGSKPLTVTWYRNETTKLKSGKNSKITFAQGEAKLLIMQAEGEDDGDYKLEAVNEFGQASLTAKVSVIPLCGTTEVPEKLQGKVKQKAKAEDTGPATLELKKIPGKEKEAVDGLAVELSETERNALNLNFPRGSRGSRGSRGLIVPPTIPSIVVAEEKTPKTTPSQSRRGIQIQIMFSIITPFDINNGY